jgi:hypothetical protein
MSTQVPSKGIDDGLPDSKLHGPCDLSGLELEDMADALWRIRDLSGAGRVILGHAPDMMELQDHPSYEGLWGILASIERLVNGVVKPIERNL